MVKFNLVVVLVCLMSLVNIDRVVTLEGWAHGVAICEDLPDSPKQNVPGATMWVRGLRAL